MAYLTRIPMSALFTGSNGNPRPFESRNPQVLHRTVMSLFGPLDGPGKRQSGAILARVEPADQRLESMLLVRSEAEPSHAPDRAQTIPAPTAPAAGTPVAFRIAVNAMRRKTLVGPDGKRCERTTPIPRDDAPEDVPGTRMEEWLSAKLAGALTGVEIMLHDRSVLTNSSAKGKGGSMAVQVDLVDGFAVVDDPAKLQELLAQGVGRAKNYGCGLLTVRAIG